MPLISPTSDTSFDNFPCLNPPIGRCLSLYRIFRYIDPKTKKKREPFYFGCISVTNLFNSKIKKTIDFVFRLLGYTSRKRKGGRYDLPFPNGTCYFSVSRIGAWLEVFTNIKVEIKDILTYRLCITHPPREIKTADLLATSARQFGITAEVHTTEDYDVTRAIALALFKSGFRALWGQIRHDPTLKERSVTLFDKAGEHLPFGWEWEYESRELEKDEDLISAIEQYGYIIQFMPTLPIPYEVGCIPIDHNNDKS